MVRTASSQAALVLALLLASSGALAACASGREAPPDEVVRKFDFREQPYGWESGLADVSVAGEGDVGYEGGYRPLPAPLLGNGHYQAGNNTSGSVCMWVSGQLAGLAPDVDYAVRFDVTVASNLAFGCDAGVGVQTFLKAGAAPYRPDRIDEGGYWRMNVDKGPPNRDGLQALTLGDIRNGYPTCDVVNPPWGERTLPADGRELRVRSAADGTIWLYVVTDSTWEVWHQMYVTDLVAHVRRAY